MKISGINSQFTGLDKNFARFIARLAGDDGIELYLGALLVSSRTAAGDICLDIPSIAGKPLRNVTGDEADGLVLPERKSWLARLGSAPVVGKPGEFRPLVLDAKGRLYLYRYWRYEQVLAEAINRRAGEWVADIDKDLLRDGLERLFPAGKESAPDWQRAGAMAAVMRKFCVISGGPGTGKTSTVVKILALLAEQAMAQGRNITAAMAAPTGKAAARLQEAVGRARESLDCGGETRTCIPAEASTIHRLLRPVYGTPYFLHNGKNPLPHDVIVVDESSMADLALMAKLAAALHPSARLILLGDRDQLSSVESGAVLGDMCDTGNYHGYSPAFRKFTADLAGTGLEPSAGENEPAIADSIIVLKRSYRFAPGSGIGNLSAAVREGDPERALSLLKDNKFSDIALVQDVRKGIGSGLLSERILEGFGPYLSASGPEEAFSLFSRFTILCAVRQGTFGVTGINALSEKVLAGGGLMDDRTQWYRGRPVMIARNDYLLRLFNGDVGITMPDPSAGDALRAFFPSGEGHLRGVLPAKLPEHDTVFAMTVHKSQGSEFDRVLLLLPGSFSPVLTRELVYTAITRARRSVEIWAGEGVLRKAIENPIRRTSGLRDALWGE